MHLRLIATHLILALSMAHAGEPVPVFILAGQSNMDGRADPAGLPADLPPPANVLVFTGSDWGQLRPGKQFGPEISFGPAMATALGREIGLVKFAKGGTNLAADWKPDGGGCYGLLLKRVQAAVASRQIRLAGLLWVQGESDGKDTAMASAYLDNFVVLVGRLRADFQVPDLPVVALRVNPPFPHAPAVRAALEKPGLARYAWVDGDDLAKAKDKLHYDAAGQIELGRRLAKAMVGLLKPADTAKP
jgi:hypothetical protein